MPKLNEKIIILANKSDDENKIQGVASGTGKIEAAKEEGKLPTFTMDAYNGGIIGQYFGSAIVDLEGVEFADTLAILWHHDTELPIGHSTSAKVEGNSIKVEGILSGDPEDPQVRKVIAMAKNGFPWQVSIGADIVKRESIDEGETALVNGVEHNGPLVIARKTLIYEVSFLPLGG